MMNCLIADDNKAARTALKHLVSQIDFLELKYECSSAVEAYNIMKKDPVDLLLLDVEMPEMTGLELLKNLEKRPVAILITSKREYAVEGFELNVADYILKPVTLPRLMAAVSKAKEIAESKNSQVENTDKDFIFIRDKGVLTKVKTDDILYVHALGDYVTIHTATKNHIVHITLGSLEQKLSKEKFYRLHRSYLVALNKIDSVEQETAFIQKQAIPIGEQYKKLLLAKLNLI
ncbi:MAG TPA: LytTR family DNA-binding domain-containing protein [Bacteroidia bacterium]